MIRKLKTELIKKSTIDIDKFYFYSDEVMLISLAFGIHQNTVEKLYKFGFVFDYNHNTFKSNIIINNVKHDIIIYQEGSDTLKYYCIKFSNYDKFKNYCYKRIYDLKTNNISEVSFDYFFHYIKFLYDDNQILTKDTFKTFVEKDKSI